MIKCALRAVEILKKLKIIIKAISTDGDTGYNQKSNEFFEKYISIYKEKGFLQAVAQVNSIQEIVWISDFLHILKLGRKHLIKCDLTIKNSFENIF